MTYWIVSLLMFASAAVGLGDTTRDQIRLRDPIQQKDQLKDGSCKTSSLAPISTIYFNT